MSEAASLSRTAVIGAGAWGTTIAWLIGGQGAEVGLWSRREALARAMQQTRENAERLPGTDLPLTIHPTSHLAEALEGAKYVVMAVPSAHLREVVRHARPVLPEDCLVISATKGLELDTGRRMSEVILEESGLPPERVLVLSGPNLSGEIAAGMPAVSVVAGKSADEVARCQAFLSGGLFRVYANYDILGVEICGALKNVLAIAAGASDGLGFGANTKAALVTRGIAEVGRLGTALGAQRATFWGAAGVGDVLATCNSQLSRNWQVGYRLGRGESIDEIRRTQSSVAEGIPTTSAARELFRENGIEAPITFALYEVLFEGVDPASAVRELMGRRWRAEPEDWQ